MTLKLTILESPTEVNLTWVSDDELSVASVTFESCNIHKFIVLSEEIDYAMVEAINSKVGREVLKVEEVTNPCKPASKLH